MKQAQLQDFKMHYVEQGQGDEVIVFVHGFISTHRWWLPTLEKLSDKYHAYAIDIRASGESESIESGHTHPQYADDLHQFIEAQQIPKFTLVGHSMGGQIAMQYALQHQDRLKALMLVDPVSPSGNRLTPEATDWVNTQQGNPEGIRLIVLGAFATPPTGEYLEQLVVDGTRWHQALYLGGMNEMAGFNVADRLAEITVPAIVTWGDKDTAVPFTSIVEYFTGIPGCGLEVWHGVGHSGPIEIPEQFVNLLTRFIDEANAVSSPQPST